MLNRFGFFVGTDNVELDIQFDFAEQNLVKKLFKFRDSNFFSSKESSRLECVEVACGAGEKNCLNPRISACDRKGFCHTENKTKNNLECSV